MFFFICIINKIKVRLHAFVIFVPRFDFSCIVGVFKNTDLKRIYTLTFCRVYKYLFLAGIDNLTHSKESKSLSSNCALKTAHNYAPS